jgi:hypothetical protein
MNVDIHIITGYRYFGIDSVIIEARIGTKGIGWRGTESKIEKGLQSIGNSITEILCGDTL